MIITILVIGFFAGFTVRSCLTFFVYLWDRKHHRCLLASESLDDIRQALEDRSMLDFRDVHIGDQR
ncbi:MAG TPA: hypothetical protein VKU60_14945 [Chloroflexota bacterium]|nr:hypothetical protein [Chloroflexota bacterium]